MENNKALLAGFFAAVVGVCGWALISTAYDTPAADSSAARTRNALHGAVDKNLEYGRQWLEEKDFKSLARTAEGLIALAQLLSSYGDDERGQAAVAEIERQANSLAQAARKQDAALTRSLLAQIGERNKALAAVALSGKVRPHKRPTIAMRSYMALMDGTHADAKAALTFGEIDEAKRTSYVLAELGKGLAAYGSDGKWSELSERFSAAATKAAENPSRDAKAIREQLRKVHQQCEACHDARR